VDSCPTLGQPIGTPLPNLGSLLQISQDADSLYIGDDARLYRVPKSGAAPQQLHASERVETFTVDGPYIYACVSDGLTQSPTYRRIVRFNHDGSDVTVLADARLDNVFGRSIVATNDSVYYVLSDSNLCSSELYRVPLSGPRDGGVDGDGNDGGDAPGDGTPADVASSDVDALKL
jgi:hypothetical protein